MRKRSLVAQNVLDRKNGQAGNRLHGQADELPMEFVAVAEVHVIQDGLLGLRRWFPAVKPAVAGVVVMGAGINQAVGVR